MACIVYFVPFPDTTDFFKRPRPLASFAQDLEKQDRNAVARESLRGVRTARSHRRTARSTAANFSLSFSRSGPRRRGYAKSVRTEIGTHFLFLLLRAQIGDGLRKILNGKEATWPAHRRDADSRELRI